MEKKKRVTVTERLEETASDMANAVSVAATGSEIGVLELAAEDELGLRPVKMRKLKPTKKKKKPTAKKVRKPAKRKRAVKRRRR